MGALGLGTVREVAIEAVEDPRDGLFKVDERGRSVVAVVGGRPGVLNDGADHASHGGWAGWRESGVGVGVGCGPGIDDFDVWGIQAHGGLADDRHG